MQFGLCRASLAAVRLFKVARLGKMAERGIQSRPDWNKLPDNGQGKSLLCNTSQVPYEEEFPSLAASMECKRRTRIDLGTSSEHKSEEPAPHIVPLQPETSTLLSQLKDAGLPTSFGKKRLPYSSRNTKLDQVYQGHGEAKRSSEFSRNTAMNEPFDICLPEARESNPPRNSLKKKNRVKWVPKMQTTEENEQHKDSMQKNDNGEESIEGTEQVLRPGMILLKHYIPLSEQVDIVNICRKLGCGPGGFYQPGYNDGAKLRLYMMCLGLEWDPQTRRYGKRRQFDNIAPAKIPSAFVSLISRVLDDSHSLIKRDLNTPNAEDVLPAISPDLCIVNFYTTTGRLGLHQDRDESRESLLKGNPVVSISIGDSAEFVYGDERDVEKAKCIKLESGDVLIFGGESRHIFHGVKTIIPNTAPPALLEKTKLRPGRLNLTFRKY